MSHQFEYGENTIVATDKGKVKGYAHRGLYIFKGIPYAKAKRFHAPEPVKAWEGVLDATSYGYVCPLLDMGRPSGEVLVPHRYWIMDEDCQNLNVWTPGCDNVRRPVMVWLHGGGFEAGSSIEQVAYEGENMSILGQVVVVSINHRLNVLGYCDLSDFGEEYANSGNAGTDDIVAALKWIRENIEAFGGNPDNVTVFGQSGGGAKVTTLLQTPAAEEMLSLFQKAYPKRNPVDMLLLDFIFRQPEIDYIRSRSGLNNCTWSYLFEQDFWIDGGRVAWHCSDIPYFFHNTELVPNTRMPGVEKLEEQIFRSVMAFAYTGDPNNETIPQWKASTPEAEHTMLFSGDTKAVTNHDHELIPLAAKYIGPLFGKAMSSGEAEIQH